MNIIHIYISFTSIIDTVNAVCNEVSLDLESPSENDTHSSTPHTRHDSVVGSGTKICTSPVGSFVVVVAVTRLPSPSQNLFPSNPTISLCYQLPITSAPPAVHLRGSAIHNLVALTAVENHLCVISWVLSRAPRLYMWTFY
jgi:hypothetical protein